MKSLRHENIYEDIGEFGPYQLLLFFLIGLLAVQPSLTGYGFIFIGATPDYQCKKPATAQRLSYNNSFDDKCFYKIYSNETSQIAFEPCTEWTYSKEYYDTTLVTEWDLVCSKSYFKDLYLTMHFIGTFAVIVTGVLSDRFGRKKVAFAFVCFNAFLSAVSAMLINTSLFELNFKRTFFAVLKLIYGISSSVYSVAIIL
ncbi:solute carrier family 22 member 4, partial [Brachionus plicatilis]